MTHILAKGILVAFLILSAGTYLLHDQTKQGVRDLGFPDFFRVQLAMMKLCAALVLVIPAAPVWLRDASYAGVVFFLITAIVAHAAHKDPIWLNAINVVLLGVLVTSYLTSPQ
jgi:putative copper export protein